MSPLAFNLASETCLATPVSDIEQLRAPPMFFLYFTNYKFRKAFTPSKKNLILLCFITFASQFFLIQTAFGEMQAGSTFFEDLRIDMEWHIDNKNNAVVDKVKIDAFYLNDNICLSFYNYQRKKQPGLGAFISCEIGKIFNSTILQRRTYTNINALTKNELLSFYEMTGIQGTVNPSSRSTAAFLLGVKTTYSSFGAYLPKSGEQGGGVPPIEVKPPTSCSLSGGTLDHGKLFANQVHNDVTEQSFRISCTGSADLKVNAPSYNPSTGISMSGPERLSSFVTINNVSADKGITTHANQSTTISVASKLSNANSTLTPGSYSGSIVIRVDII